MLAENSSLKKREAKNVDIVKLLLIRDKSSPYRIKSITKAKDAVSIARDFLAGEDREVLIVMNLDASKKINSIHVLSIGSVDASMVHPREVFKTAILSNASSIMFVHNHPSGNPDPSDADENITCKIFGCGDLLGIKVLDHIIIGEDRYAHCYLSEKKDGKIEINWITDDYKNE